MSKASKSPMFYVFLGGTFLDFFLTMLGIAFVMQMQGSFGYFVSGVFALAIVTSKVTLRYRKASPAVMNFCEFSMIAFIPIELYSLAVALLTIFLKNQSPFSKVTIDWHESWQTLTADKFIFTGFLALYLFLSPYLLGSIFKELEPVKNTDDMDETKQEKNTAHLKK